MKSFKFLLLRSDACSECEYCSKYEFKGHTLFDKYDKSKISSQGKTSHINNTLLTVFKSKLS